jgi:hypothetical protein
MSLARTAFAQFSTNWRIAFSFAESMTSLHFSLVATLDSRTTLLEIDSHPGIERRFPNAQLGFPSQPPLISDLLVQNTSPPRRRHPTFYRNVDGTNG